MLFCFLQSFQVAETTGSIDLSEYLFTLNTPEYKFHVGRDHMGLLLPWIRLCPQQLLHQAVVGIILTVCINTGQHDIRSSHGSAVPMGTAGLRETRC